MKAIKSLSRCSSLIAGLLLQAGGLDAQAQTNIVHIPDAELQSVIRETLNKPTGDITVADMESLTVLDASVDSRGAQRPAIASLEGLEAAQNLRVLNLASFIHWMYMPDPTVLSTTNLSAIATLSKLENLDLSFYYYYAPANPSLPSVLSSLTNLQTLVLLATPLTDTSFLNSLIELRILHLSDIGLTNMSALAGLTNLETLQLGGNDLGDFSFLNGLTALRSLSLSVAYQLENVSIPMGLSSLSELYLQGSIRTLALPDDLSNLRTLNLSGNRLTDISLLARLPNLRKLDVSYNQLSTFPTSLSNLTELALGGNPINDFTFLRGLHELETLYLSSSPFVPGDLEFLRSLPRLRELYLGYNALTNLVFAEGFAALETLSIPNAQLQSITLFGLPNLRRLTLRENQLTTADLGGGRRSLQHLDLSFNRLRDVNFLEGFSQLQTLAIYNRDLNTMTLPGGLVSLRELGLWYPPSSPYTYLGLPASIDLAQLVIHGFPKDKVTVLGFWIHPPIRNGDGSISLRVNGAHGKTVQVQRSSNLVDWEPWQTVVLGGNGVELVDDAASATHRFFRVLGVGAD